MGSRSGEVGMDGGMGEWMKEWMKGWTKGTARGERKAKKMGRVGVDRLPFMLVVEGPIFFWSLSLF